MPAKGLKRVGTEATKGWKSKIVWKDSAGRTTNSINWHQVCNMISYKRDVLERQSLSEVKMGRGSPICERPGKKIVEYLKNNVPQRQVAKALQIS